MKKETKTATQTAVPEKPAAPERVHGLDLISKYRGAIMGFAALWILFWFFCKCWGRRKQRSFGKNQMRTAL